MELQSIDYKDWFINQKRVPSSDSEEYAEFYAFHKELCKEGFMMNGIYINPFLYWHLNFWHTEVDIKDDKGRIFQKYANPSLRDNEWLVTNEITRAEKEQKGLVILGIRRLAKSVIASSYMGLGGTFDQDSQNIVSGLNAADIKLITDKIDKGLNFLPEAWTWDRIEDNWKQQVTLGIKLKSGKRIPFSQIMIRNLDEGNNEEAIAGTKPRKLIIDEIGKGSFLRALQAAIPGFTTPFGWGCSPILTGTGGDMKKFFDAKQLMFDVEQFNFLTYKNEDDHKRIHGLFIGAKYRMEAKDESSLGAFLGKTTPELLQIPMLVSDEEKALRITEENIEKLRKAGDKIAYLKEKMYYPKKVDDIFLNEDTNIYNIEAARAQQVRIKTSGYFGSCVELYNDGGGIKHKFSKKDLITEFPVKNQSKDAPIAIWEFPIENPPFGLYTAGVDPYRQGKSSYSDSLGAVYIFKRMHSITGEGYQNMFVASYVARPDNKDIWDEQARLLIKYYNARTLCENDEISFIEYMKAKGDSRYLERQPEWLKEIVPNTTVKRDFGIHRSAEKIRDHLHGCLKAHLDEKLVIERDDEGSITVEHLGVMRVKDTMLLEEVINFNEVDNFDREVAASLAVALAYHLDPIIGQVSSNVDARVANLYNKAAKGSPQLFKKDLKPAFKQRKLFHDNRPRKERT